MKRLYAGLPLVFAASNLLAQDTTTTTTNDNAAGAAAGLIGGTCGCIGGLVGLAIWIFLVVYVYRDAKARGMDNAVLLTILTAFTGLLGFVIYLLMRPKTKIGEPPTGSV
ncbi:MAG: hypothetical protein M3032_01905 [Verrucomicrobiota bacterium]|nr:hypothetical protein [Verrucomicrobiota bacterium]